MTEQDSTGQDTGTSAPSNAELDHRIDGIDAKIGMILERLPTSHAQAEKNTADRLDAPSSIADEIRQQLEAKERDRTARDQADAREARIGALETSVAELSEKTPEPPRRRIEQIMGWAGR